MGEGTRSGERGQALPLMIMMFVILCGFVGLTIDVGFGLLQKQRLQSAVDLGALSGAQRLPGTSAASDGRSFTQSNFALASDQQVDVTATTSCMVAGCTDHDRLLLAASTRTPTFFLSLFGIDEWTVVARGAACGPCDSSPVSYDIVVVLDRSYSMCLNANNSPNGCSDLTNAKNGIRELLTFFDDDTDRVSLAVLSSADTNACTGTPSCPTTDASGRPYSHASASYNFVRTTSATAPYCDDSTIVGDSNSGNNGRYWRTAGDFMDGSTANHDRWVVVSLADGTNYKNSNGTLNESSTLLDTLDCLRHKYYTPIAPAIFEATEELRLRGRTVDSDGNDVYRAIVFFGDGGANASPARRTNTGALQGSSSWYTPLAARPCDDAVEQAKRAYSYGIHVYSIGYALGEGSAAQCGLNSGANDSSNNAATTMQEMAQGNGEFYQQANAGDVSAIFREIGHAITAGGTRLVE